MAEINGRVGWRNYVSPISPLWNNLVAYYSGDNTPNDSKGTYNGTLVNGATYSTGKINGGFSLDGINDYVSLPNGTFAPTGDFSISLWFNFSELPVIKSLFNVGNFLTNSICVYIRSTGITFLVADNSTYQVLTAPSPSFNTWYNVVCVKNTTDNKYYLYINGALSVQNTITINHVLPANPINNIGYNPSQGGSFLPGKMDEVGLWNRALTVADVTELYNAGAGKQYVAPAPTYPIITNGLSLYYDISNPLSYAGSGTTLNDLSGNANTATLYNGVGYSSSNGGILTLDGINDYISAPHSTSLVKTSTGALFIWVKLNVAAPFRGVLVAKGDVMNNRSAYGILQYDYQEIVSICSASTNQEIFTNYPPSTWRQIGLVWNGSTIKKYVNGVEVASVNQTINVNDIGSILRIGQYVNMNFGELYLYNTITPTQITTNFNATKTRYGI